MKYIIVIFLITISTSCVAQPVEKQKILQKVFNAPEVLEYFHPELESRNPYYLLTNKFLSKNIQLSISKFPVVITKKEDVQNENYIKLNSLDLKKDRAKVSFYYKLENAEIVVILKNGDNDWQVEDIRVTEY